MYIHGLYVVDLILILDYTIVPGFCIKFFCCHSHAICCWERIRRVTMYVCVRVSTLTDTLFVLPLRLTLTLSLLSPPFFLARGRVWDRPLRLCPLIAYLSNCHWLTIIKLATKKTTEHSIARLCISICRWPFVKCRYWYWLASARRGGQTFPRKQDSWLRPLSLANKCPLR